MCETVKCGRCGELSQGVPKAAGRDKSEAWGRVESQPVHVLACAHCGATNLQEAHVCQRCYADPAAPGTDYCLPCDAAIDREEADIAAHTPAQAA